jgi:hypothetical protein
MDHRAESFIDLARALYVSKNVSSLVAMLRRVVKAFRTNVELWLNLGIAFALGGKHPFAPRCFCVGVRLADGEAEGRALTLYGAVSLMMCARKDANSALGYARRCCPGDPDVWKVVSRLELVPLCDALEISCDLGLSPGVVNIMPEICIRAGRFREDLHFALVSGCQEKMSMAYEAMGDYRGALKCAPGEASRRRLHILLGDEKLEQSEVDSMRLVREGVALEKKRFIEWKTREVEEPNGEKHWLVERVVVEEPEWDELNVTKVVSQGLRQKGVNEGNLMRSAEELFEYFPSGKSLTLLIGVYLRLNEFAKGKTALMRLVVMRPGTTGVGGLINRITQMNTVVL